MSADQSTMPRWCRVLLFAPLAGALFVWGAGSALALAVVTWPEGMCRWPYAAWALLWPLFAALPEGGQVEFVRWSMLPCQ